MGESDTGLFNKEKGAKRFDVGDETRSHYVFPFTIYENLIRQPDFSQHV